MIYTFYSYKGGVGRSMALANVAAWYRERGLRTVMVDWDLEAPGLEAFFEEPGAGDKGVRAAPGLIDLLEAYKRLYPRLELPAASPAERRSAPQPPSQRDLLFRLEENLPPLEGFLCSLMPQGGRSSAGELRLLSAGWRSGDRFSHYVQVVQSFDWTDFYRSFHGELYFEWLRRQLLRTADVVLIDSRTGVTEMGGVCTRQLADIVVCLCAPNFQNLQGLAQVIRSFNDPQLATARSGRPLRTVVVPARIDNTETDLRNAFEAEFKREIPAAPTIFAQHGVQFWDLKLPYVPKYSYRETLVIGAPDRSEELAAAYEQLASRLALLAPAASRLRTETRIEPTPAELAQAIKRPAELVLELTDPDWQREGSLQGAAAATATLSFIASDERARPAVSRRFRFVAPLRASESADLRWYLASYAVSPLPFLATRAERLVASLQRWGACLLSAIENKHTEKILAAWYVSARVDGVALFTVNVDPDPPAEGGPSSHSQETAGAAAHLLALPWELLADNQGILLDRGVRLRRTLPRRLPTAQTLAEPPLRILLLSPRPLDAPVEYLDHRLSAMPVLESLSELGAAAELTILRPPSFAALAAVLAEATFSGRPFHVVHFDGHGGVSGPGGSTVLLFEDDDPACDRVRHVSADELAALLSEYRIPLVLLEACDTGVETGDAPVSIAAKLLACGVGSVVAMRWAVRQDTARKFVTAFYRALTLGCTIGEAVAAGQKQLRAEPERGWSLGAPLTLSDWFVPMLFQSDTDTRLLQTFQIEPAHPLRTCYQLGSLPAPPRCGLIGRSRELLAAERRLSLAPFVTYLGMGGIGKTAVAAELARWLVVSKAFDRALYVDLAGLDGPQELIDALMRQTEAPKPWGASSHPEVYDLLRKEIARTPTLVVLDSAEALLTSAIEPTFSPQREGQLDILKPLLRVAREERAVRLCFCSRYPLPPPLDGNEVVLSGLALKDAVEFQLAIHGRHEATEESHRWFERAATVFEGHPLALAQSASFAPLVSVATRPSAEPDAPSVLVEVPLFAASVAREHFGRQLTRELESNAARLAVVRSHALLVSVAGLLELEVPETHDLVQHLARAGAAQLENDYLVVLHPALAAVLREHLDEAGRRAAELRWARIMMALTRSLDAALLQGTQSISAALRCEEPNLLGTLAWAEDHPDDIDAAAVVVFASSLEKLFTRAGAVEARDRVADIRLRASERLGETWSRAAFLSLANSVEQKLNAGMLEDAHQEAALLVGRALDANGPDAHPEAVMDAAVGLGLQGRVLRTAGQPEQALAAFRRALALLESLTDQADTRASHLLSATLSDTGQCLHLLGRLEEAAMVHQRAASLDRATGSQRSLAVDLANLADVYLRQDRLSAAQAHLEESLRLFETLGEPASVAAVLHQLGHLYQLLGQVAHAEAAYQRALELFLKLGSRPGEAGALGQLGNLYHRMGRIQEAADLYQQAAAIYRQLDDRARQAITLHNLGALMTAQGQAVRGREILLQALDVGEPFGSELEPWKTWAALQTAEEELGNTAAAQAARRKAIDAYVIYRRTGGQTPWAIEELVRTPEAGRTDLNLHERLEQLVPKDQLKSVMASVEKILAGSAGGQPADDPTLPYHLAAELELLQEKMQSDGKQLDDSGG